MSADIPRPSDTGDHIPVFSFRYADRAYQNAWRWPGPDEASGLLEFICEMSKLTWSEITSQETGGNSGRHRKHHDQPVTTLVKSAQDRLGELHLDQTFEEYMFRFRLGGTQRLWGFRQGGVFYVIWWDPDHQIYPTPRG